MLKIKNATKKGYLEAEKGDIVDFSFPMSKFRRGRVGKGEAHTLDTQCNQAVVVSDIGGAFFENSLRKNASGSRDGTTNTSAEQNL